MSQATSLDKPTTIEEAARECDEACPCRWEIDTACHRFCACLRSADRYTGGFDKGRIRPCTYKGHAAIRRLARVAQERMLSRAMDYFIPIYSVPQAFDVAMDEARRALPLEGVDDD